MSDTANNKNNNDDETARPRKKAKATLSGFSSRFGTAAEALEYLEDQDELLLNTLSFFDTATLCRWKRVSKRWRDLCTTSIDQKCRVNGRQPKKFESGMYLGWAVQAYCRYESASMERLACTYGYPIGKWDVSKVECFNAIFVGMSAFNEDIGSWDVSNAKSMHAMFRMAIAFNQDLNGWDVSNVTCMTCMFWGASSFNQSLNGWNINNVICMNSMFEYARAFDQVLDQWDTSRVKYMKRIFADATSFSHRERILSSWDMSSVEDVDDIEDLFQGFVYP